MANPQKEKPPPLFADLGKDIRDLFSKGYHIDLFKIDVKTKTETDVEFGFNVVNNLLTSKVLGSLDMKYKFKEYDLTWSEKWNTNQVLQTELALEKPQGCKFTGELSLKPKTVEIPPEAEGGETKNVVIVDKTVLLRSQLRKSIVAFNLDAELKAKDGPIVSSGLVVGWKNFSIGALLGYNFTNKETNHKLGGEFFTDSLSINLEIANARTVTGSIYHKISDSMVGGIQSSWVISNGVASDFGVAGRYKVNEDSFFRFKINLQGRLGLGYSQKLKEGVTVHFSSMLPGWHLMQEDYHFGFCLELTV